MGKINFLRRFIPNLVETMKLITDMLNKYQEIKWTIEAHASFENIKKAVGQSLVLISLDYTKDFLIFSFASENTIVAVLLQKNEEEQEQPIAFFSKSLRDFELRYATVEKQTYALVKALKSFRDYILHSKVIAYVPSSAINDVLIQPDNEGKRVRWIDKIQKYDLDIKLTKLLKGQGLENLLT